MKVNVDEFYPCNLNNSMSPTYILNIIGEIDDAATELINFYNKINYWGPYCEIEASCPKCHTLIFRIEDGYVVHRRSNSSSRSCRYCCDLPLRIST